MIPARPWDRTSPLTNGLGVSRLCKATLGAPVRCGGGSYLICSAHVMGETSNPEGESPSVYTAEGWIACPQLVLRPTANQPGAGGSIAPSRLDIAFVEVACPARATVFGNRVGRAIAAPTTGCELSLLGCLDGCWHICTLVSKRVTDPAYDDDPEVNSHFGVITLPRRADPWTGDSGSPVWVRIGDACHCAGHLVAVRSDGQFGVIVLYGAAFETLGIVDCEVVG